MTGLLIAIAIIVFILMIKAKVILILHDDVMALKLRICGIPITILPKKEKEIKLSYYSKEAMEKRKKAAIEKKKKAEEKKRKKKEAKAKKEAERQARIEKLKKEGKYKEPEKKPKDETALTLIDNINAGVSALGRFFAQFGKRLRIDVTRIIICVGTGDAANTAIMYGAVVASVNILLELLNKITNINGLKNAEIDVRCDYLAEKTTADVHIAVSLRVWHLFDFIFAALRAFLRKRKKIRNEKIRLAALKHKAAQIIAAKRKAASERKKQDHRDT